jgi:hypothetical protein
VDPLLEGVPVTRMRKTTPGRYLDRGAVGPETACDECLCKRCAQADCPARPKERDCADVCIGRHYIVASCTSFISR